MPTDFPPYTTVQGYSYQWRDEGRWETIIVKRSTS
jgi:putative transposase